jgi:hypothetical protein
MGGYQLTAIIEREGDLFVARCVELDIASKGPTGSAALSNLRSAVRSFMELAGDAEIEQRLTRDVEVTQFEIDRL